MKGIATQIDSVGWKAPAGRVWQEKYAEFTDVSNINCFADTLISYATMWYQQAARDEEGIKRLKNIKLSSITSGNIIFMFILLPHRIPRYQPVVRNEEGKEKLKNFDHP